MKNEFGACLDKNGYAPGIVTFDTDCCFCAEGRTKSWTGMNALAGRCAKRASVLGFGFRCAITDAMNTGRMRYTEIENQGRIASRQHRKRRCRNTGGAKKILSANFTKTICDL